MTTLKEVKSIAARQAISSVGCLPNEWEPDGRAKEPWSDEYVREIDACRAFIRSAPVKVLSKRTWSKRGSYGFKHDVERESGLYVHNGSFIVAAFLEGLDVRRHGINASFRRPSDTLVAA